MALKGYSVGTCFIADVVLQTGIIHMYPAAKLGTSWKIEMRCDAPAIIPGFENMPDFPNLDRNLDDQLPSHLQLLIALHVYSNDDVLYNQSDVSNRGIGFTIQQLGDFLFLFGFNSRSLNKKSSFSTTTEFCLEVQNLVAVRELDITLVASPQKIGKKKLLLLSKKHFLPPYPTKSSEINDGEI
jgi:hypothetical protein